MIDIYKSLLITCNDLSNLMRQLPPVHRAQAAIMVQQLFMVLEDLPGLSAKEKLSIESEYFGRQS